jgi:uncharacterized membrane protein
VLWIGGVAFVTTVLLPAARRRADAAEAAALFDELEKGFAWQARGTTLLVGATGFTMTWLLDGWDRFQQQRFWWMHAMVLVWVLFTIVLFVLEPLFLHDWFRRRTARDATATLRLVHRLHIGLLVLSLVTIAGAVAGAHGMI